MKIKNIMIGYNNKVFIGIKSDSLPIGLLAS